MGGRGGKRRWKTGKQDNSKEFEENQDRNK